MRRNRPRCEARTRRGTPCQAQGRGRGGRCRLHGGASTGPTAEGRRRISEFQKARWARVAQARARQVADPQLQEQW